MSDPRERMVRIGDMTWFKTGTNHYHEEIELPDKGHAIKRALPAVRSGAFGTAKQSGPRFLSTGP